MNQREFEEDIQNLLIDIGAECVRNKNEAPIHLLLRLNTKLKSHEPLKAVISRVHPCDIEAKIDGLIEDSLDNKS